MEERRDYEALQKIENQQRNEAEQKREEQRKADEIKRVAEHQYDILWMEKLEKKEKAQRVLEQRAHEQLMITMMQNMFQGFNVQPQRQPTTILLYPPVTTAQDTTQAPISASQTENELVISMEKTKLA